MAFWSLASGLHAIARGFVELVVFRFLLGLAEPGGWTGAVKVASERFGAAQRGLVTGLFSAGATVGAVIAVPLTVFVSLHYGWRSAFLGPAIVGLLWIPLWLRVIGPPRQAQQLARVRTGLSMDRLLSLVRDRRVLGFTICRFFCDSSAYFFLFWIPEYLVSSKGFSFAMLGALGWIPFCSANIGALLGGYASGRLLQSGLSPLLARKLTMTVASGLVTLGILSHLSVSAAAIILALSASAFGVGVWSGNLHAVAVDGFPNNIVATVHGVGGSAGAVGGILFNTLIGHFSATRNHLAVFGLL
jgi:ACS family hexuronate transporter-like MFS transporter